MSMREPKEDEGDRLWRSPSSRRSVPDMTDQLPRLDLRGDEPVIVRPSVAVTTDWLRSVLVDDVHQPQLELLDTFVGFCAHGIVPDIGGSIRADAWRDVLTNLRGLGAPSAYVGAFKVRLDAVVHAGAPLTGADRGVLARLLIDRAAVEALTKRDFRVGIAAARTVDPTVVSPAQIVDAVLRPFVRSGSTPSTLALVPTALQTACAVLATGGGDAISEKDALAVRAVIDMIDEDGRAALAPDVALVTGADRALLDRLLALEPPRRWWSRGRSLARR